MSRICGRGPGGRPGDPVPPTRIGRESHRLARGGTAWGGKKKGQEGRFRRVEFREINEARRGEGRCLPRDIDMRKVRRSRARRVPWNRLVGYSGLSLPLDSPFAPGSPPAVMQTVGTLRLIASGRTRSTASSPRSLVRSDGASRPERVSPSCARLQRSTEGPHPLNESEALGGGAGCVGRPASGSPTCGNPGGRKNPSAPTHLAPSSEAPKKLGFTAKRTMSTAQRLYEVWTLGSQTVGLINLPWRNRLHRGSRSLAVARPGAGSGRNSGMHTSQEPSQLPGEAGAVSPGGPRGHPPDIGWSATPDDMRAFLEPGEARCTS